jgi:SAM-dependent methyltransferase
LADPQGLAFDPVAADYDRGRPGWPDAVVDGVEGSEVLDLGAGTGKLTALLARRFARVVAVEPSEGMLAVLRRHVPAAETLLGGAEAIPLPDGSLDAAFVAEAAHWFDPAAAGAELRRVVRPGGTVTVCFNEWRAGFELPAAAEAAVREVYERAGPPGGPKAQSGAWRAMFEGWPRLAEESYEHEASFSREEVAAYYVSVSNVARLPEEEREALRATLLELLAEREYRLPLTARVSRTAT